MFRAFLLLLFFFILIFRARFSLFSIDNKVDYTNCMDIITDEANVFFFLFSRDENIDDTDSSNCAQPTSRKTGRQQRQEIVLNEVNCKRSSCGGRPSRDEVSKVSADAMRDVPNGEEEAKVKIQITKDGIRVISDKETTV